MAFSKIMHGRVLEHIVGLQVSPNPPFEQSTDMRRLMTGLRSENCVVR